MKRYTLKFRVLISPVTAVSLKDELERVLLRLHPRITYKIKHVYEDQNGMILAEIAMDEKKQLLEAELMSREWKIPVRLESMGWGWLTKDKEEMSTMPSTSGIDFDPLATISALNGQVEFILSERKLWLRYISLLVSTAVMIMLLVVITYHKDLPVLQGIYIIGFLVWLIVLNETPFDVRMYATKITCDQEGIKVKYWYRKLPKQIRWEEVQRMEFTEPVCQIFSEKKRIRLLVSEKFGCKEQKLVLKTIVDRACLNYVRGNFMTMEYRRYDA